MCREEKKTFLISSRDRISGTLSTMVIPIRERINFKDIILGSLIMPITAGVEMVYIYIHELGGDCYTTSNDYPTFAIPVSPTATLFNFSMGNDFIQRLSYKTVQSTNTLTISVRTRNNATLTPSAEWTMTLLID